MLVVVLHLLNDRTIGLPWIATNICTDEYASHMYSYRYVSSYTKELLKHHP